MNDTYKVRDIGGTLVVTLPRAIARALSLKAGDRVTVHATALEVVIAKAKGKVGKK